MGKNTFLSCYLNDKINYGFSPMLKLLEDMHMTQKEYVCCCHAWGEDASQVLGCDSNSKLAFEATTEADTMVSRHVPKERGGK